MCTVPPRRPALYKPGEMIAAIPAMLGFHPNRSLVIIVYTGHGADHEVASLLRIDFPEPDHHSAWLAQLRAVLANQHAASMVLAPSVIDQRRLTPRRPSPFATVIDCQRRRTVT